MTRISTFSSITEQVIQTPQTAALQKKVQALFWRNIFIALHTQDSALKHIMRHVKNQENVTMEKQRYSQWE